MFQLLLESPTVAQITPAPANAIVGCMIESLKKNKGFSLNKSYFTSLEIFISSASNMPAAAPASQQSADLCVVVLLIC